MSDPDRYLALSAGGSAETKVKGSRFLGFAIPVESAERADREVRALQKKNHDATHVCFAWRIGHGAEMLTRAADAGEPSGTAGIPILGAIERAGISDCLVAVVRWFGGTKLGTGGLTRAYGDCARLAVEGAPAVERVLRALLIATFDYTHTGAVLRVAKQYDALPAESDYAGEVRIRFEVPRSRLGGLRDSLVEATAGHVRLENA